MLPDEESVPRAPGVVITMSPTLAFRLPNRFTAEESDCSKTPPELVAFRYAETVTASAAWRVADPTCAGALKVIFVPTPTACAVREPETFRGLPMLISPAKVRSATVPFARTVPPSKAILPPTDVRLRLAVVMGFLMRMSPVLTRTVIDPVPVLMFPENVTVLGKVVVEGRLVPLVLSNQLPIVTLLPMPERLTFVGLAFSTPMLSEGVRLAAVEMTLKLDAEVGTALRTPTPVAPPENVTLGWETYPRPA